MLKTWKSSIEKNILVSTLGSKESKMFERNDLGQWQVVNPCPELGQRKPEELFQPEFAEQYSQLHKNLWQRIMCLNGTIYTLETLNDRIPLGNLLKTDFMDLPYLFVHNYVSSAIILLHGLVNDRGGGVHSVLTFKDKIWKDEIWLDTSMCEQFHKTVEKCKFGQLATFVYGQVQKIRNEHIAHSVLNPVNAQTNIRQLRESFNSLHTLFGALSFGHDGGLSTLPTNLAPVRAGKNTRLDKMLDAFVAIKWS